MADEPQRHRIELACPECGHLQVEPALVISTQCRACRAHYQVRDGKGVAKSRPVVRLASPRAITAPEPPAPAPARPALRYGPAAPKPRPLLKRLIFPSGPPREVPCFQCGHLIRAVAEAQSSQCPKCGTYVSLLDYDIDEPWNRAIHTRGNVTIRKTGSVAGVILRCHHLTMLGTLTCPVECSGNLVIRRSGKIAVSLHCHHLRVEKGARVEFLHPVQAVTATIDGHVRGQISCTGPVILEKRAQLHGLLRTSDLVLKSGARHTGTLEKIPAQAQRP